MGSSWYIMCEFGGWCGVVGRIPGACRGWWRRTGKEKLPGIAGEGLAGVSGGGGPQAARPQGGQAGGARFGAAEQRRACGPYPGFCRG